MERFYAMLYAHDPIDLPRAQAFLDRLRLHTIAFSQLALLNIPISSVKVLKVIHLPINNKTI